MREARETLADPGEDDGREQGPERDPTRHCNTSISLEGVLVQPPFVCPGLDAHVTRWRMRRSWMALGVGVPLVVALAIRVVLADARCAPRARTELPSISKLVGRRRRPPRRRRRATLAGLELSKLTVGDTRRTAPLPEKKRRAPHDRPGPPARRRRRDDDASRARGGGRADGRRRRGRSSSTRATSRRARSATSASRRRRRRRASSRSSPRPRSSSRPAPPPISASATRAASSASSRRISCPIRSAIAGARRSRGAMGRSINTVFARLALAAPQARAARGARRRRSASAASLPFDVPVQPSAEHFPEDQLGFARTAAGFWNTTLSPLHAAWLSATIARGGEPVRPVLVAEVADEAGKVVWTASTGLAQKRVIKEKTAEAVTSMMESTVSDGTSYRAFHDPKGAPFLPERRRRGQDRHAHRRHEPALLHVVHGLRAEPPDRHRRRRRARESAAATGRDRRPRRQQPDVDDQGEPPRARGAARLLRAAEGPERHDARSCTALRRRGQDGASGGEERQPRRVSPRRRRARSTAGSAARSRQRRRRRADPRCRRAAASDTPRRRNACRLHAAW